MRRYLFLTSLLWLFFLIFPASAQEDTAGKILVFIEETAHISVQDNGKWIRPGDDAAFVLVPDTGYTVASVRYSGDYLLNAEEGAFSLTLLKVAYPSRVVIEAEKINEAKAAKLRNFRTILYDPNDGTSAPFEETYGILIHPRPNTHSGADIHRDGYTLTGWNTAPDGTGEGVGLGSRVTVPREGLCLYGQWAEWSDARYFAWEPVEDGAEITGYTGAEKKLVIPG